MFACRVFKEHDDMKTLKIDKQRETKFLNNENIIDKKTKILNPFHTIHKYQDFTKIGKLEIVLIIKFP